MGSLFSSPAAAAGDYRPVMSLIPKERRIRRKLLGRTMLKETIASLDHGHDGRVFTIEELCAQCICWLAHRALKHYNDNNPGAEFQYPVESTTEMKAACIGFREGFIWYHLSFSARRRDNEEMHLFFAEMCYDIDSPKLNVETCTILEKPSGSSCAFCPEESKIMHPSEREFVCGKEGQQTEFFRMRHMLLLPWETLDL